MSFLNPVNEPVTRFKSTDVGAPQINYNSRTAGDVKAVLKACLVTGYGAIASAGWSIVNEVAHVIEFVSPSAAMSDYRLGIDDTSVSATTWYYQYQDARVNPDSNDQSKNTIYIDAGTTKNGWQLLVTERGLYFVEIFYHTVAEAYVARLTWWGQVKSGLNTPSSVNISFFSGGYEGRSGDAYKIFTDGFASGRHLQLSTYTQADFVSGNIKAFLQSTRVYGVSVVDSMAEAYLSFNAATIAQQPGLLLRDVNSSSDVLGVADIDINGRAGLSVALSSRVPDKASLLNYAKVVVIRTDYWEF